MSDIALVGTTHWSAGPEPGPEPGPDPGPSRVPDPLRPGTDRDMHRWRQALARMENPGVRWERVAGIRAAIERGGYLTPARLDAAVDGLLRDLAE
ncbi:MAG: hypothetical protein QF561_07070 [Phycisphaerales bacterium]|jgi:hypothetical protein|nr:hypothetical protein [Phycisphaerales bacterium]